MAELPASHEDLVTELYRRYGATVHRIALSRLGRRALAEEATQETMLRVWRAADRIDLSRPVLPWLVTIAVRVSIDIERYERRRPAVAWSELHDIADDHEPDRTETAVAVRDALAALEPESARQLWLCDGIGVTLGELSALTGHPTGTLKSRAFRAHRRLAALLAGSDG
ncbi:MAG: sigma-70 family RNA polymerase sigma factor [Acidimicrobiales bacterium]